ncbi:MAG: aminoacyl-tRNA hydrolase [Planctomycetota bacterium]|jgi:PTH1 family peptidyl-tRNA hydrolase
MKIVLGLGNPGDEYSRTRHNVGFAVVEALSRRHRIAVRRRRCRSLVGRGTSEGRDVVLARPQTFMNDSGRAASALLESYGLHPADLLVVCDDFNLELGAVRVRRQGSSGGQKGLESIIESLGTTRFPRLRIGIGPLEGDPVEFVLGAFAESEIPLVEEAVSNAVAACAVWVRDGIDACMNAFN